MRLSVELSCQYDDHDDDAPPASVAAHGEFVAWAVDNPPGVHVLSTLAGHESALQCRLASCVLERPPQALCIGAATLQTSDPRDSIGPGVDDSEPVLIAACDSGLALWRLDEAFEARRAQHDAPPPILLSTPSTPPAAALALSPCGEWLAAACGDEVVVAHLPTLQICGALSAHAAAVTALAFRGTLLASGGEDRTVALWDAAGGDLLHRSFVLGAFAVSALAFHPALPLLAACTRDGAVVVFDAATPRRCLQLRRIDLAPHIRSAFRSFKHRTAALEPPPAGVGAPRGGAPKPRGGVGSSRRSSAPSAPTPGSAPRSGGGAAAPRTPLSLRGSAARRPSWAAAASSVTSSVEEREVQHAVEDVASAATSVLAASFLSVSAAGASPPSDDDGDDDDFAAVLPGLLTPRVRHRAAEEPVLALAMTGMVALLDAASYSLLSLTLFAPHPDAALLAAAAAKCDIEFSCLDAHVVGTAAFATAAVPPSAVRDSRDAGGGVGAASTCCLGALFAPCVDLLSIRALPSPGPLEGRLAAHGPCTPESSTARRTRRGGGASDVPGSPVLPLMPRTGRPGPPPPPRRQSDEATPLQRAGVFGALRLDLSGLPGANVLDGVPPAASAVASPAPGARASRRRRWGAPAADASFASPGGPSGTPRSDPSASSVDGGDANSFDSPSAAHEGAGGGDSGGVSVFPTRPPPKGSPLTRVWAGQRSPAGAPPGRPRASPRPNGADGPRAARTPRSGDPGASSGASRAPPHKPREAPVTFHSRVASSGYGKVFPKTRLGQMPAKPTAVRTDGVRGAMGKVALSGARYPMDSGPPVQWQPQHGLPGGGALHRSSITCLAFSPDAHHVASASHDRTCHVLRVPLSRHGGAGTQMTGHDGAVTHVSWSHDSGNLLTASADCTAKLWNAGKCDALLTFAHVDASVPRAELKAPRSGRAQNGVFRSEVTCASFYYLDKFVLLSEGPRLHLYWWALGEGGGSDIERLRARHAYRRASTLTVHDAHTVVSFSAHNGFLSHVAALACSNRSIQVVDLAVERVVGCIGAAHERNISHVSLFPASAFSCHEPAAHDLLLSNAPDGAVKLWDVRSLSCVRTFAGHLNSQHAMRAAMAPCARYVAVGSEDQTLFVYDARSSGVVARVREGLAHVPTAVAFHPGRSQIAVGCLDGGVSFYGAA